jgi:VanZ family protein
MKKRYMISLFLMFSIFMLLLTIIPGVADLINGYDIILHFMGFFILSLSIITIFNQFKIKNTTIISIFILICLSVISEIIQIPIPKRNFEWVDLLFDFIGISFGLIVNYYMHRK